MHYITMCCVFLFLPCPKCFQHNIASCIHVGDGRSQAAAGGGRRFYTETQCGRLSTLCGRVDEPPAVTLVTQCWGVCALILGALVGRRRAACLYCARRPCYKKIGPRSCVVATPQGGDQCAFYAQTRDGQNTRAIPPITLRRWAPWPRVTSHFLLSRLAPCSHKVSILSKR